MKKWNNCTIQRVLWYNVMFADDCKILKQIKTQHDIVLLPSDVEMLLVNDILTSDLLFILISLEL